ncbi:MAG: creatininase family protein [Ardenticatenaceae bacterium]|nr:creatininase family protein [Ardenticatenaceae bacterium]
MTKQTLEKYRLFEMTRPEVEQAIAAGVDTVVATFGSTEQHGLHLPLGTDSLWGEFLGDRVARALGDALVAPGVRLGCSEHHMAFAGSLTLREETYAQLVADVCRSLAHHGFRHLVLIPTHGGNFAPLGRAVAAIEPQLSGVNLIAFTDLMAFMDEVFRVSAAHGVTPEQAGGHAGEHETSLMLAVRPDLVAMADAQPGYVGDQLSVAPIVFQRGFRAVTENGVLGDPREASATNGEAYLEAMTEMMVRFIRAAREEAV